MQEKAKTTVFGNSLIWFGAAISIAEILTGTLFAPLGFQKALLAIVLGHILGGFLFYFAGSIGARYSKTAMDTAKLTFGDFGGKIFAGFNLIQLLGWTAVMIASGAQTGAACNITGFLGNSRIWAILICILILLWIKLGVDIFQKANIVTMLLLLALSIFLTRLIFHTNSTVSPAGELSFGEAVELSIAMPVSWLPLIADYTSKAAKPRLSNLAGTLVYSITSCWMYVIGLAAVLYTGESDIGQLMTKSGFGIMAMIIVILSTVTTTFLDVYSAEVSARSIWKGMPSQTTACIVCIIGTILATICDTSSFESFLYFIGSIFVPMITIQIMDLLVYRQKNSSPLPNIILWLAGFILYRIFMHMNSIAGSTIPDVISTVLLFCIVRLASRIYKLHIKKSHNETA